eukprot:TRINITY_DN7170_c0_g3_i5.p1 TRINITY_DN7170_c0_g3~~TRINITY_DN7170_c0_g3_i5.p1  ORF type:complete len:958 (+),score=120.04 TRINITY_DN7170_c0_g3_i5:110-2983(+)
MASSSSANFDSFHFISWKGKPNQALEFDIKVAVMIEKFSKTDNPILSDQVSVYNANIENIHVADKIFQEENGLSAYDPFNNGGIGNKADNPKEMYVGPPRPNLQIIDYQQEGNKLFRSQQFEEALKFYNSALEQKQEVAKLLGNISACLQKQDEFMGSLLYAYSSVRIDEFYNKGWFRISEALKHLGRNDELQSTYKHAKKEVRDSWNISKFPRIKNNNIEPMYSIYSCKLRNFVQTKNVDLEGSFGDLKAKGNDFFRRKDYSSALNYYLSALDFEKNQVSVLLKNRAACQLKLKEYLDAAIDASVSILLNEKDNNKAVLHKASALREMGLFQLAIQSIQSENDALQSSPLLQQLLAQLEQVDKQNISKVKNSYKSEKTHKDALKELKETYVIWCEQIKKLHQLRNLASKHKRALFDKIMYDTRVPNFYDEYFEGGFLPLYCDQDLSKKWLLQSYHSSITITKKLEAQRFLYEFCGETETCAQDIIICSNTKDTELQKFNITRHLAKALEQKIPEKIYWWRQPSIEERNLLEKTGAYSTEMLQSFSNVWFEPIVFPHGAVHVAVGYVDLGILLTAHLYDEQSNQPMQFIGYEQSVYCTAKTLVITQMLKQKVDPKIILQVWYSSGWSVKTLQQFRQTVTELIKDYKLVKQVADLMRHWLAVPRLSLLETQQLWIQQHPDCKSLAANALKKHDRMELISYALTGRLLECEFGSVVMFANPPSFFHRTTHDETVTWLLKEELVQENYDKYGSIIGTFVGPTLDRIRALSEKIHTNVISVELRLQSVTPNDKNVQNQIKDLCPQSISWSNLVDQYGIKDFHKMASACSGGNTAHFVHSMNWLHDVKGSLKLDNSFHKQYEFFNDICEGYSIGSHELEKFGKIFLLHPVDYPWTICDGFLLYGLSNIWEKRFYSEGGVGPQVAGQSTCFPFSIFQSAQGILHMFYSYSDNAHYHYKQIDAI